MDIKAYVTEQARQAKLAGRIIGNASTNTKNAALIKMASGLRAAAPALLAANQHDLEAARKKGLSAAMIDRLTLNEKRIEEMALGLEEVAALPDPVGEILKMWDRPNGMKVGRMRVPIGLIGIIYESRPNVTADATALCLKSGNSVILRGGSEAIHSNKAIVAVLGEALAQAGLPAACVTFVDTTDRKAVAELVKLEGILDLVIPRGGEGLIRAVMEVSRVPVLKHYKGVCHAFVDRAADLDMARAIVVNAKCQRPGTCNALETLLVDAPVAAEFLPKVVADLQAAGVKLKGCARTRALARKVDAPAMEADFHTEYVDLIMNIRVVEGMVEAMDHIATYSSAHTDTIITSDYQRAMRFIREVDSSAVMVNASTRLNDGFQFGLGAEIGIATDKLHARGPMGLEELTSVKFIVLGSGQLRQ